MSQSSHILSTTPLQTAVIVLSIRLGTAAELYFFVLHHSSCAIMLNNYEFISVYTTYSFNI
jgi:hypothetical protein